MKAICLALALMLVAVRLHGVDPLTALSVKKASDITWMTLADDVIVRPVACVTTKDFYLVAADKLEAAGQYAGLPGHDGRLARYPAFTKLLVVWDTKGIAPGCYSVARADSKLSVRVRVARP